MHIAVADPAKEPDARRNLVDEQRQHDRGHDHTLPARRSKARHRRAGLAGGAAAVAANGGASAVVCGYSWRMKATRAAFSRGVSCTPRTRLKNSTVSSNVSSRPSCR
jgi:hypothetical protein